MGEVEILGVNKEKTALFCHLLKISCQKDKNQAILVEFLEIKNIIKRQFIF